MVHRLSAVLGFVLVGMSLAALFGHVGAVAWLAWLVGAAGVVLLGAGAIDRDEVSRVTRAKALIAIGLGLGVVVVVGKWTPTATSFIVVAAACAAAAALMGGVWTLAARSGHLHLP